MMLRPDWQKQCTAENGMIPFDPRDTEWQDCQVADLSTLMSIRMAQRRACD